MTTTTIVFKNKRTKARFKAKCSKEGKSMKEVFEKFIAQYLKGEK